MTIEEYISRVAAALSGYDAEEVDNALQYYTEILEDSDDPSEQMEKLGTPEELAERIKNMNGWNSYNYMDGGQPYRQNEPFSVQTEPAKKKRMSGGRVAALILLSWAWISAYVIMAALLVVVWAVYICFPAAAVSGMAAGAVLLGYYVPFSVEMFGLGFLGLGASILLFRPAVAATKGIAEMISGFSRFLFAVEKKETPPKAKKPVSRAAVFTGTVLLAIALVLGAVTLVLHPTEDKFAESLGLEDETFEFTGSADSINVSIMAPGEIKVVQSDGDAIRLEAENFDPDKLSVSDGEKAEVRYDYGGIQFATIFNVDFPKAQFTLYIPKKDYESIYIATSVGDLKFDGLKADSLVLECDCGNIVLTNCELEGLTVRASLGNIEIKDCTVSDGDKMCNIEADCGNIGIISLNAQKAYIKNSLGDITVENSAFVSLRTDADCGRAELDGVTVEGEFNAALSMGDADFDNITAGNIDIGLDCGDLDFKGELVGNGSAQSKIELDLGNADIKLKGEDYNVKADTDMGAVKINGEPSSMSDLNGSHVVRIHNSCGDVKVESY